MSGKSTWIKNLLLLNAQLIYPAPHRILWIFKRWQPLYDELKHWIPNIQFIEGITEDIKSDALIDSRERTLLIIDDMMKDATQDKEICELYTEGAHHRNLSVICIMQNLFNKGKENRTMSLNSQYIVLFKNPRDRQQIAILARQMYPGNAKKLLDVYEKAVSIPYGSLILDLKQTTQESKRFQTNIFEPYIRVPEDTTHHLTEDRQGVKTSPEPTVNDSNPEHQGEKMAYQKPNLEFPQSDPLPTVNQKYQELRSYPWPSPRRHNELEEKFPSCSECGTLFSTSYDLQRHARKGCPMEEQSDTDTFDDDNDEDGSDEDHDDGFNSLVNEVWEENHSTFSKKVEQLMKENVQLSEKEAREDVREMMLSKDRALLMKKYKTFLLLSADLNRSKLHRNIKEAVMTLIDKRDIDLKKAVSLVLNKNKEEFDELLEADESTDEDEMEDEDDTEESDEN